MSIFSKLFGKKTAREESQTSASEQPTSANDGNATGSESGQTTNQAGWVSTSTQTAGTSGQTSSTSDTHEQKEYKSKMYNLIILDESGSMDIVRRQTISGCNETLGSIRNMAKEDLDVQQLVSIYCFQDLGGSNHNDCRYLLENSSVGKANDISESQYRPNGCTPLYDAIGESVTSLHELISTTGSSANVTIITDGLENASRKWTLHSVTKLISALKKKGWVFTFIGANIDVVKTASGLGIDSAMEFRQTDEGMNEMFEKERRSREAYNMKMRFMSRRKFYMDMDESEKQASRGNMNANYFVDKRRIAPDHIKSLADDEIFVFGSNTKGMHNGGAALYAKEHFGAVEGQTEGIQGQSYAIPTDGASLQEIKEAIERFNEYVVLHPRNKFMLTAIGCGSAGYTLAQIAPLLREAYSFGNVYVPKVFLQYLDVETKD